MSEIDDYGIDHYKHYFTDNSADGFDWWINECSTIKSCHDEIERMIEVKSKTLSDIHTGCPADDPSWFHTDFIVPYVRMGFLCNMMNLLCHGLVDVCERLAVALDKSCPNSTEGNQIKKIRSFIDNTCGIKVSSPRLWNDIEALYKMRNYAVHDNGILPDFDAANDHDESLWEKDYRLKYLRDLLDRLDSVEFNGGLVELNENFANDVSLIGTNLWNELKIGCRKQIESIS